MPSVSAGRMYDDAPSMRAGGNKPRWSDERTRSAAARARTHGTLIPTSAIAISA